MLNIQINNKLVKINKYSFLWTKTGIHKHIYDYIICSPITDGKLLLIDKNGEEQDFSLIASHSILDAKAGVEHNVFNNGKQKLIFN